MFNRLEYSIFFQRQADHLYQLAWLITAEQGLVEPCFAEALVSGIEMSGDGTLDVRVVRNELIRLAIKTQSSLLRATSIEADADGSIAFSQFVAHLPKVNLKELNSATVMQAVLSLEAFPRVAFVLSFVQGIEVALVASMLSESVDQVKAGCRRAVIGITQFIYPQRTITSRTATNHQLERKQSCS